jgi:hypothetical protein
MDTQLKKILTDMVDLVGSLEEEIRSLQVLTTHRVDQALTDKLGMTPQSANALHVRVKALREKIEDF